MMRATSLTTAGNTALELTRKLIMSCAVLSVNQKNISETIIDATVSIS
jgi:hypothetical protein